MPLTKTVGRDQLPCLQTLSGNERLDMVFPDYDFEEQQVMCRDDLHGKLTNGSIFAPGLDYCLLLMTTVFTIGNTSHADEE
jgi:hypothetical protein